jgi:ParB family chromosome partitioning protein
MAPTTDQESLMKFSKAEVDAIIEASPRTFVPFNKLVLSEDHQARSATAPAMSLPELAASIKDSGVLQNLVVVQGARGRYEVCAGGRRLAALTLLVQQGDIADNYPVPVLVVPADKALIASLAENCFHVPMHPADEFAAFARLLGQGKSVEDVAAAFGVTPLIVKRRMKLATVSPRLMALYRKAASGWTASWCWPRSTITSARSRPGPVCRAGTSARSICGSC